MFRDNVISNRPRSIYQCYVKEVIHILKLNQFKSTPIKVANIYRVNAPINGLPQDGGVGQPRGNLTFSGFQTSISPHLGHHCKSNSHP